jgi:hypothetical protein
LRIKTRGRRGELQLEGERELSTVRIEAGGRRGNYRRE